MNISWWSALYTQALTVRFVLRFKKQNGGLGREGGKEEVGENQLVKNEMF